MATVIGATSFIPDDIYYGPEEVNCVDRSGMKLSYFADIQAGWEWIHETIYNGTKLISPDDIYPK